MPTSTDRVLSVLKLSIDRAYDLASGKVVMKGVSWQFDDPAIDTLAWTSLIEQSLPSLGTPVSGYDGATPDDVRRALTMLLTLPDAFALPRIVGVESEDCDNHLVRRAAKFMFSKVLPDEPFPAEGGMMDAELMPYAQRGMPGA